MTCSWILDAKDPRCKQRISDIIYNIAFKAESPHICNRQHSYFMLSLFMLCIVTSNCMMPYIW